jgi:hypothetical protein
MQFSMRLIYCILILICWPATALAAPPVTSGADNCRDCHETESSAWLASPHAAVAMNNEVAATCEQCHGAYDPGHPDADLMALKLDSSVCIDCHSTTVEQWEHSRHAEAGVECVSCHMAHSQEFRLTDDRRCSNCHREESQTVSHAAHGLAEVNCTDCHVGSAPAATDNDNLSFISTQHWPNVQAPDHDFVHVSNSACLKCHTDDAHSGLPATEGERVTEARLVAMAECVPGLTTEIDELKQSNWNLTILIPVALGAGVGIGGILGIVWMLACSSVRDRGSSS